MNITTASQIIESNYRAGLISREEASKVHNEIRQPMFLGNKMTNRHRQIIVTNRYGLSMVEG